MKIKFIGSSSRGNCGIVDDGETVLLLDAGMPLKEIQVEMDFDFSRVAGVLVTHEHKDHSRSVKDLMKRGVDCYMPLQTAESLGVVASPLCRTSCPECERQVGTYRVLPLELRHDVVNYGYLIRSETNGKKLLYMVDTAYCPYKFSGVNYFCIEINYVKELLDENVKAGVIDPELRNRIVKSHFSLEHVLDFLKENDLSKAEKVYALHLSAENSDAAMIKDRLQRATGLLVDIVEE